MKMLRLLRGVAVSLACLGLMIPRPALATEPAPQTNNKVADVALANGGVLHGQVVNAQGAPVAKVEVRAATQGNFVGTAMTDDQGQFAIADLRGGVYHVGTVQNGYAFRIWDANTAPPVAQPAALIVTGEETVRGGWGKNCCGWCWQCLTNPWVMGAIVAAAIAIPLALDDDDAS